LMSLVLSQRVRRLLAIADAPMRQWTAVERRWAVTVGVFAGAVYALLVGSRIGEFFVQSDLGWYFAIARGQTQSVIQPFASRQLGPLVVRALVALLHCSVETAFALEGGFSILLCLGITCLLATRTSAPRWVLAAILAMPFWPQLLFGLALPDLWYAGLLSVFLWLLYKGRLLAAACMLFPLMVSRESTSLTLICFLVSAWPWVRWRVGAIAVGASVAGSVTVAKLTAHSLPTNEHLPQFLYLAAKLPWNFLRNICGVDMWTNVNPICGTPVWQHPLHLGAVHSVGFCGLYLVPPLLVLDAVLTTFGLLPLLVVALWWRSGRVWPANVLLRFCLVYGVISFLLAPLVGVGFYRLFGYAWPLFAVGLPLLFDREEHGAQQGRRAGAGITFCLLHLTCCWATFQQPLPRLVELEAALWVAGFFALRAYFGAQREPFPAAVSGPPNVVKSL
jgi:hypothetical protein